ncbi:MAG: hydantoinase/oxoprolinase family protein [Gammaproteobacteria bacterium]|jgi:N-methylhydantoinase A|nr:hydantoinase/oxoprolinase family protein [Gammaproteobacteria bacterium]
MTSYRIGFDVGGTFTDSVVINEETSEIGIAKVLTTPEDPSLGVLSGVKTLLENNAVPPAAVSKAVTGGTTLITNALIERKGAHTALITSKGFRDILELGREARYDIYDLFLRMPEPFVPRNLRMEVTERILKDGSVLEALDEEEVHSRIDQLIEEKIESIAICLMHAYINSAHERRIGEMVRKRMPDVSVTLSSDVIPEIREYERTSTTVANAYVQPLTDRHFRKLADGLADLGIKGELFLMQSNGGIVTANTAREFPIKLTESGPAAGALAAVFYGQHVDLQNLISFDMGGTTAKACIIDEGQPTRTTDFEVARVHRFKKGSGLPIKISVIDMIEIGAGGGSIAYIDDMGLLKVGPKSAGAVPGPTCYGRDGTEPTVTDADLVLGFLDPDYFLGGTMVLDKEAAEKAIHDKIAKPLGISTLEAARGIHEIVNQNMATAAKIHVAEHGKDPRNYAMVAFGGAGPVHVRGVAKRLYVNIIVSPLAAGVMSAVGLLTAPPAVDFVRSYITRLENIDWSKLAVMYEEMKEKGLATLQEAGIAPEDVFFTQTADMRYAGQGYEIEVPVPNGKLSASTVDELRNSFYQTYEALFDRKVSDVPVEAVNWRLTASGPAPEAEMNVHTSEVQNLDAALKGSRQVYYPDVEDFLAASVYDHYKLYPGAEFSGPAIVEQRESTTVLGPGDSVRVDPYLNLIIELKGAAS